MPNILHTNQEKIGQIANEMENINEKIVDLEQIVDHLQKRLDPILMNRNQANKKDDIAVAVRCPLAENMRSHADRVFLISMKVREIIDSLEI